MNTTATAADLNTYIAAAAQAIEAIAALTELEFVVGDNTEADHTASGMAKAMVLKATGPTGSMVVAFSESIAQHLAETAGVGSEDPDDAWTELSRVGLAGAEAFVAAVSQAGALVGPVDEIAPVDTATIDAEGPFAGVEVSVTAGVAEGSIWLLLLAPAPEIQEPEPQIETIQHPELGEGLPPAAEPNEISLLSDVSMEVTVELGRTVMRVRDVLDLSEGSVVELTQPVGAHVSVLINGSSVALGEVVVIDDVLGVRITSVTTESN